MCQVFGSRYSEALPASCFWPLVLAFASSRSCLQQWLLWCVKGVFHISLIVSTVANWNSSIRKACPFSSSTSIQVDELFLYVWVGTFGSFCSRWPWLWGALCPSDVWVTLVGVCPCTYLTLALPGASGSSCLLPRLCVALRSLGSWLLESSSLLEPRSACSVAPGCWSAIAAKKYKSLWKIALKDVYLVTDIFFLSQI